MQFFVNVFLDETFTPLEVLLVGISLLFPIFYKRIRNQHFNLAFQNDVKGITPISAMHNIFINIHCLQFKCIYQLLDIFILEVSLHKELNFLQKLCNLLNFILSTLIEWLCQHLLNLLHFIVIFEVLGFLSLFLS